MLRPLLDQPGARTFTNVQFQRVHCINTDKLKNPFRTSETHEDPRPISKNRQNRRRISETLEECRNISVDPEEP